MSTRYTKEREDCNSVATGYEGYNIPYTESSERFYEALNIILRAWTTDTFSYEGKFHTFRDVTLVPKPLQNNFIPPPDPVDSILGTFIPVLFPKFSATTVAKG